MDHHFYHSSFTSETKKKHLKIGQKYPKSSKHHQRSSKKIDQGSGGLVTGGHCATQPGAEGFGPGFNGEIFGKSWEHWDVDETMWENLQKNSWMKGDMLKLDVFWWWKIGTYNFLYGKC